MVTVFGVTRKAIDTRLSKPTTRNPEYMLPQTVPRSANVSKERQYSLIRSVYANAISVPLFWAI